MNENATAGNGACPGLRVISVRRDRIGARLCSMANGLAIARAKDLPFYFHWPIIHGEQLASEANDFRSIFSQEFYTDHMIGVEDLEEWSGVSVNDIMKGMKTNSVALSTGKFPVLRVSEPLRVLEVAQIDSLIGGASYPEGEPLLQISAAFREIGFSSEVMDLVARASANIGLCNHALHVRRGDVVLSGNPNHCRARYAPLEFSVEYLEKEVPLGEQVFVFSDSRDTLEELRALAGGRWEFVSVGKLSENLVVQACVELILMSRMPVVAGTLSAFRQTACLLGGAKSVNLNQSFSRETSIRLMRKAIRRLENAGLENAELVAARTKLRLLRQNPQRSRPLRNLMSRLNRPKETDV